MLNAANKEPLVVAVPTDGISWDAENKVCGFDIDTDDYIYVYITVVDTQTDERYLCILENLILNREKYVYTLTYRAMRT